MEKLNNELFQEYLQNISTGKTQLERAKEFPSPYDSIVEMWESLTQNGKRSLISGNEFSVSSMTPGSSSCNSAAESSWNAVMSKLNKQLLLENSCEVTNKLEQMNASHASTGASSCSTATSNSWKSMQCPENSCDMTRYMANKVHQMKKSMVHIKSKQKHQKGKKKTNVNMVNFISLQNSVNPGNLVRGQSKQEDAFAALKKQAKEFLQEKSLNKVYFDEKEENMILSLQDEVKMFREEKKKINSYIESLSHQMKGLEDDNDELRKDLDESQKRVGGDSSDDTVKKNVKNYEDLIVELMETLEAESKDYEKLIQLYEKQYENEKEFGDNLQSVLKQISSRNKSQIKSQWF